LNNGQNFVQHSKKYVKTKKKIVIKVKNPKNVQNTKNPKNIPKQKKQKKPYCIYMTFALTVVSGL